MARDGDAPHVAHATCIRRHYETEYPTRLAHERTPARLVNGTSGEDLI